MKYHKERQAPQDKCYFIQNYKPEPFVNQNKTFNIINNCDLISPHYNFPQTTKTSKIPSFYNSINFSLPQFIPISPKRNFKKQIFSKEVLNEAYNQYNQSPKIKKNLTFIKTDQIPLQNNNIIFNQIRRSKQDKIIRKSNQE